MNLYSFLSLIVFIIYVIIGFYALKLDKKSPLNQAFFIVSMAMALWSLAFTFFFMAPDKESAWFFYKLSSWGRSTHPALLLIFSLILTRRYRIWKNKFIIFLLLVPALIFVWQTYTGPFITGDLILLNGVWYEDLLNNSPWWTAYSFYFVGYNIVSLFLVWEWGQSTAIDREKKQSHFIFYSALLVLFLALFTNAILPSLAIYSVPAVGNILGMGVIIAIWYSITHYQLMQIDPSMAGEIIMDKITDMVILLDPEGNISRVNPRLEMLLGFSQSSLRGRHYSTFIPNQVEKKVLGNKIDFLKLQHEKRSRDYPLNQKIELHYPTRKGDTIPVEALISLITSEDEIAGFALVAQDQRQTIKLKQEIQEKLKAQENVKRHLKALQSLNELIVSMNQIITPQELLAKTLDSSLDLLEFQKGGVYLIEGDDLKLKIHKNFDDDMLKANSNFKVDKKPFASLLTEGSCFISNCYPEINPEKARRWKVNSLAAVPLKSKEEILGMLVVFGEDKHPFLEMDKNILESIGRETGASLSRIKAEEEIISALKDKEVLLTEIHHRVKNNMQIISSLLNLQTIFTSDENIRQVIRESQGRVRSMALVHEHIYHKHTLSQVDLASYMEGLLTELIRGYQSPKREIVLDLDVEDMELNLDTIIPLGLILNELVTNSLKYAFQDRLRGLLSVKIKKTDEGYCMEVKDDGVGLPPEIDIENTTTLGLMLVQNLTQQIEGVVQLVPHEGAYFKILFQEIYYKDRF